MLLSAVRTCSARIAARYASNFGQRNGGAIANKASILSDVDEALTGGRPSDLEVLLADHLTATDSPAAEWARVAGARNLRLFDGVRPKAHTGILCSCASATCLSDTPRAMVGSGS